MHWIEIKIYLDVFVINNNRWGTKLCCRTKGFFNRGVKKLFAFYGWQNVKSAKHEQKEILLMSYAETPFNSWMG